MEEQEIKHYLTVLVELTLYPELTAIMEGTIIKKDAVDIEQQKQIIKFINELPDEYKKIPNRDEIIASTLNRMGMNTSWATKKIEEIEMMKKRKISENTDKTTQEENDKTSDIEK